MDTFSGWPETFPCRNNGAREVIRILLKEITPQIGRVGPYVVKRVGQQRLLFNPSWSLKRVELSMQINISAVKPACSPFISMSYTGWLAWLHGQSLTLPNRVKRNVTDILGTGLGVLNSIDMKYLQTNLVQPHMI